MANIYKNAKVILDTTDITTLYTTPSNSRAIIKSILVCNTKTNATTITVTITDASSNIFELFDAKDIAAFTTEHLLTEPVILEENEILKVEASNANRLHVVASILEINRD
tara:strand:+ start:16 stop:345 length:330 start_codon:yes stop_codon:yes gene_type:complete